MCVPYTSRSALRRKCDRLRLPTRRLSNKGPATAPIASVASTALAATALATAAFAAAAPTGRTR